MKNGLLAFLTTLVFVLSLFLFFQFSARFLVLSEKETDFSKMVRADGRNSVYSPIGSYNAASSKETPILASVVKGDGRPILIDNFLARHNSPMRGLGATFVMVADKYGLDYRLLPAIAFQESTLGKNMPKGSHNAFGWAVYTGTTSGARFHDWEFAIETVAAGLKKDYIDRGLTSVDAIMTRYTPDSGGAWAFGVNFAMSEMTQ